MAARENARAAAVPVPVLDDGWGLIDALGAGVLLLDDAMRVLRANARWAEWNAPPSVGRHVSWLLELERGLAGGAGLPVSLDELLHAVRRDGAPRDFAARIAPTGVRLSCTARGAGELVVVDAHRALSAAAARDDVAHRLAEVTDIGEVLGELCDIAMAECSSDGSAVLRVVAGQGEVVAACGIALPALGRSFSLAGSMLNESLRDNTAIAEENFRESGRPLMKSVPELSVGPVLAAPLRAHGEPLGVLAVMRSVDGQSFVPLEREALAVLADHAALAVHKSMLLQQAQSADRAKGRFLATMSHELRTPLTALAGYGELLADQVIGPLSEPQLDILDRMRSVTMHLSSMIEEILAFTSLEEGREIVRPTEFLAEDLARAAAAVIEPLAQQKSLALVLDLPRASIRMTSDVDKARQILVNLLGNAVKFTDAGTVRLRLSRRGSSVCLEVSDTGMGIADEELTRLFRPFAQVDTGLTRRHGGTGLGLYISRRLATLLGGHIEVSSTLAVGSTFRVLLPGG